MPDKQDPKPPQNANTETTEGLAYLKDKRAQNLRDNLAKRKAQVRARQQGDAGKSDI